MLSSPRLLSAIFALSLAVVACCAPCSGPPPTAGNVPGTGLPTPVISISTPGPVSTLTATSAATLGPTATQTLAAVGPAVTTFPDPTKYRWAQVVSGLQSPIGMANAGDGSGRLFVIEQSGRIRIVQDDKLLNIPFLDITDRVGADAQERGLLGLAFHPRYKQNGYFYVNYTDKNGNTVIARFQVGSDPNVADPVSEK